MRFEVQQRVGAPRQAVWDVLITWERQPEWMVDAKDIEILTPQRRGEGVTVRCPTNLLGVTVQDVMRVTGWDEPRYLEVTHLGRIITGFGAFELAPDGDDATLVTWWEEIEPPLGRLGEWGATMLVAPILRRIFSRSLRNLAAMAEHDAARGDATAAPSRTAARGQDLKASKGWSQARQKRTSRHGVGPKWASRTVSSDPQ